MYPARSFAFRALICACLCGAAVIAAASTAFAASSGHTSAAAGSLTIYSGQHEQTIGKLVARFEKQHAASRSTCAPATRRRSRTRSSRRARRRPPTSSSPRTRRRSQALAERRACSRPSRAATLAGGPGALQLAAGRLGRRLGPRRRCSSTTRKQLKAGAAAASILDLAKPEWKGKLGVRPGRDRLPAAGHRDREARRQGRRAELAEGAQEQREGLPRQRGADRRAVNKRRDRDRARQPLLLVPPARRGRREQHALGAALLRAARPRRARRRLRRRALKSSKHQAAAQQLPRVPRQQAGAEVIADERELRVPARPGRHDEAAAAPLAELAAAARQRRAARRRQARARALQQVGLL